MARLALREVISGDGAYLIDGRACFGGKPLSDGFNVAHSIEKPVGLGEERELLYLRCLIGSGYGIEVIGNEVQRNAGLMVLVIQKIFEEVAVIDRLRSA